jgi:hypothetical protein
MKFTIAGSRIICSRKDNTANAKDAYRRVVEFDAHVESVPPHVAARLTSGELEHLKEFMADRQRIQANPANKNMLEALPGLLDEARDILESTERVNMPLYEHLSESISALSSALEKVTPARDNRPTHVSRMRDSEAQKERLENIRQEL